MDSIFGVAPYALGLGVGCAIFLISVMAMFFLWLFYDMIWCLWIDEGDSEPLTYTNYGYCSFSDLSVAVLSYSFFTIPAGFYIGLIIYFPVFSAIIATAVSIAYLTRFSRRLYKAFKEHTADTNSHNGANV